LRASGENDYANLTSEPTGDYVFSAGQGGAIANQANLALKAGADLTLIGGTVVNTGNLSAPAGNITLAAVPGESLVHLRLHNSLLTLELSALPPSINQNLHANNAPFTPLDLPSLLTHSQQTHATNLVVNADGTVSLTGTAGTILTRDPRPGEAIVSGSLVVDNTNLSQNAAIGGNITVVGNQVSLLDATLSASGLQGGGTLRIGGDYRGQSTLPTATHTYISSETVLSANALLNGQGGRVNIWANDTTQYLGNITAMGGELSGNGGTVEVSGKKSLFFDGAVDTRAFQGEIGSLLLDPENIVIVNGASAPDDGQVADSVVLAGDNAVGIIPPQENRLTLSERTLSRLAGNTALTLEANNNITVEPLMDQVLAFRPGTGAITFRADADGNGIGDFTMSDPKTTLIAPGRNVSISGANLRLGDLNTAALLQAGSITLSASGLVTTGNIDTHAPQAGSQSGNVSITAADITTRNILTESPARSGNVSLIGQVGSITTGVITATSLNGSAGNIMLSAPNSITVAGGIVQAPPPAIIPTPPSPAPPVTPPSGANESAIILSALSQLQALGQVGAHGGAAGLLSASQNSDSSESSSGESGGGASSGGYASQRTVLSSADATVALTQIEGEQGQKFSTYFGHELNTTERTLEEIQQMLVEIEAQSGNRSAIIHVQTSNAPQPAPQPDTAAEAALTLLLVTADSPAVSITIPELTISELTATISQFRADLLTSVRRGGTPYLSSAQKLYQWLIAPVEKALEESGSAVDTLAFAMDTGLRTLPIAALHDGEQFLIEKYSIGMLPSLGLVDTQYSPLKNADVMAMGASSFEQLEPLPAVPLEVEQIHQLWPGAAFLNEGFTRNNLIEQQAQHPYQVVHLATHAEFSAGNIGDSYIQLWDGPLHLDELQQLGWQNPPVDLLVLSACSTAVGSPEAEMGFAGLAVASGVRSAMASLWSVDDVGTLALMREFYQQLQSSPTKAEALQAAQLAMLNGTLHIASGQLLDDNAENALSLPSSLGILKESDFSHPYYWSGFTMIGSPW
jgi:CHAT domain-containing protein